MHSIYFKDQNPRKCIDTGETRMISSRRFCVLQSCCFSVILQYSGESCSVPVSRPGRVETPRSEIKRSSLGTIHSWIVHSFVVVEVVQLFRWQISSFRRV